MAERNGSQRRNGRLTPTKAASILQAAFVHSLKATRLSQERAARSMGIGRATAERYVSGRSEVNAKHVLRSATLWRPFWLCVGRLMHRARKAA